MTRREKLGEIFANIDADQRDLIEPLLDEVVYLEGRMRELRTMPFIRVHKTDPSLQKSTPAAKQYKEASQSYMNAIRILSGILRNTESDAADKLTSMLDEFISS